MKSLTKTGDRAATLVKMLDLGPLALDAMVPLLPHLTRDAIEHQLAHAKAISNPAMKRWFVQRLLDVSRADELNAKAAAAMRASSTGGVADASEFYGESDDDHDYDPGCTPRLGAGGSSHQLTQGHRGLLKE